MGHTAGMERCWPVEQKYCRVLLYGFYFRETFFFFLSFLPNRQEALLVDDANDISKRFQLLKITRKCTQIKELLKQAPWYCNDVPLTDVFFFRGAFFMPSTPAQNKKTLPQVEIHMSNFAQKRRENE